MIKLLILADEKDKRYNSILVIIDCLIIIVYYELVKVIIDILSLVEVIISIVMYYHGIFSLIITD